MALVGRLEWHPICPNRRHISCAVFVNFHRQVIRCLMLTPRLHTQYYVILALRIRTTFLDLTLEIEDFKSQNMKPGTAELALQAIIIILPTILIAGFLAFESHRHKKLIGKKVFELSM